MNYKPSSEMVGVLFFTLLMDKWIDLSYIVFMSKLILDFSEKVKINFNDIIDDVIEKDCREEAEKIIKYHINGDFLMRFQLLNVYKEYLNEDIDALILEIDNLKLKLIKDNVIPEKGCFGVNLDD